MEDSAQAGKRKSAEMEILYDKLSMASQERYEDMSMASQVRNRKSMASQERYENISMASQIGSMKSMASQERYEDVSMASQVGSRKNTEQQSGDRMQQERVTRTDSTERTGKQSDRNMITPVKADRTKNEGDDGRRN
jgi:hypothetical protein